MADKTLSDVVNKLQDIENKINNVPTKGDSKLAAVGNALSLKSLGEKIKKPFTDLKDGITKPFKSLKDAVTKPFSSLKDTLMSPFESIKKGFSGIGNFFKNKKEQKTLAGLEEVMRDVMSELIGVNVALEDLIGVKLSLEEIENSLDNLTDSGLNINKLPSEDSGDNLGDIEDKKESRKLLVRIAEALESGGGGGAPDIKASGPTGALGKLGKSLGAGIGGLLKGIGGGFKYLGKNFGSIIKGAIAIGAIGLSLIPAAKAFQEFGEVTWSAVAVGLTVLAGLAITAGVLSLASPAILIGAGAIAVLALAMLPAAFAFKLFAQTLNEHLMPALAQLQPIVSEFIDSLVESFGKMADIVEGFIAGTVDVLVGAFERGVDAIGGLIQTIAAEVKSLAALDGDELESTAKGILAIGGALAAFGVGGSIGSVIGSIADGFRKLVGAEGPIDKLRTIASLGPNLEKGIRPLENLPRTIKSTLSALKGGLLDDLVIITDQIGAALDGIGKARVFGFWFDRSDMKNEFGKLIDAAEDYFEAIEDGLDSLDMSKLEKLNGLTIQMGTIDNAAAQAAASQAAPTIINNYYDNSSISSTNVNQTTLNETNIADDGAGTVSPAFS